MRDSGQPDWKCGEVAARFELKGPYFEGPLHELSGGWQTRVKLASLLLHDPNLLILDEPTNFLDLRTQILLEYFLRDFKAGCLIVSHDRSFLAKTCDQTLELSRGALTMYSGDIESFLANQDERRLHDERVNATIRLKRKQLETFILKNRGQPNTASQARSKAKQLERLQEVEITGAEAMVRFRFPSVEPRQGTAMRCQNLAIGYPDLTVAENISLEIEHGRRVAVVGDNGQGKTTFLRTIADSLEPKAGGVKWGYHCNIGCYAQHVYTSLPPNWSVQQYLDSETEPGTPRQTLLAVAGSFLFHDAALTKPINVLSGGERARLCLAGILLSNHNILILDEPGNHLDVETVEALADALCQYRGTVMFTSHDRHFMHRVATDVIEVRDGRVTTYEGDYDMYVYRVNKQIADGMREAGALVTPAQKEMSKEERKQKNKQQRSLRKEISGIEKKIARLDEEKTAIHNKLMQASAAREAQNLHEELAAVTEQVIGLEEKWFQLQERVGE
jgi:ATP-binding cassette subfamily F protein 3